MRLKYCTYMYFDFFANATSFTNTANIFTSPRFKIIILINKAKRFPFPFENNTILQLKINDPRSDYFFGRLGFQKYKLKMQYRVDM